MSQVKEQLENARKMLDKHGEEIRSRWPNSGTGIGYKIRKGMITDEVAIIFYVKKKKSKEDLSADGKKPIPENFYGIPTDVQELELQKRI
jgi:hypothetical protein